MSVIVVRMKNVKRSKLLTPTGGLTGLRIHAMTGNAEHLEKIAADLERDNADKIEWAKVIE